MRSSISSTRVSLGGDAGGTRASEASRNGVYVITEQGEKYLDGELDTAEDAPDDYTNGVENNNGHQTGTPEEG